VEVGCGVGLHTLTYDVFCFTLAERRVVRTS